MADERCGDCYYWVETHIYDGKLLGECHRFPPADIGNRIWNTNSQTKIYIPLANSFRITFNDSWCGEFKKIKKGKKK